MRKHILVIVLFIIAQTAFCEEYMKKTYAVLPFSKDGNVSADFIKGVIFKLEHFLTQEGMIITSRERITEIMEEKKFASSAISDRQNKEIGQILSADYILTGFIEKKGMKYLIAVQKISVNTGRVEESYFIETSPEDVFFTKSAEYLAKKLTGTVVTENKIFKEENSVVEIKNSKINVKKININYFEKDRYEARYIIVDAFGRAFAVKGELYIDNEVFDIYQIKGDKYPKTTEDIVSFMPLENKVSLSDGTTGEIIEELNNGYIKLDDGDKIIIKNAKAVAWQNRLNNIDDFLKNYNAVMEPKGDAEGDIKGKTYSIDSGNVAPTGKKLLPEGKIKIKAANFEGEIDKKEVLYIIPAFYRIKLKDGFVIRFFEQETMPKGYLFDNTKTIEYESVEGYEKEILKTINETLHSGFLDDPFYFDEIKEDKVRKRFKDYYINNRGNLFMRNEMSVENLDVVDLSFLKGYFNLERLKASENKIKSLNGIENLKALDYIELNDNEIQEIGVIKEFKKIKTLEISNNKIKTLEEFAVLKSLKRLNISKNRIFDIESLAELIELEEINLSSTRINSINDLKKLKKLKRLDLSNNRLLIDIEPLKHIDKIGYINISGTNIEDITPLDGKLELSTVIMANTRISKIEPLKKMKFLSYINLWDSPVNCRDMSDWSFSGEIKVWNGNYGVTVESKEKGSYGILNGNIVKNY